MARFWHKPGVLMTTYLVLFVAVEEWAASRSPSSVLRSPRPARGVDGPGGGARLIALRRLLARRSNQKIADLATHRV